MHSFHLKKKWATRLKKILSDIPNRFLLIDTRRQLLSFVKDSSVTTSYPVSTSKYGIGNRKNSFMTPPGIHRIVAKIGKGAPPFRIFKDRKNTGRNWKSDTKKINLILTRILRLDGMEDGINHGPGIDSFKRYIYIHGTNREEMVGTPFSHGCVCMKNEDIISLFDQIKEGTIVIID